MVKKIFKSLGYLLFFILSVSYLSPKENMYYYLEQELKPHGVIISKENIIDELLYLNVDSLNVSYKEIDSMMINNMQFNIFALYNHIGLDDIKLAKALSAFVPVNITSVNIYYSILNPLNITASAQGEFGEMKASFNILEYTLHVNLLASKLMLQSYKNTLKNLTKTENGEYTYDKSF